MRILAQGILFITILFLLNHCGTRDTSQTEVQPFEADPVEVQPFEADPVEVQPFEADPVEVDPVEVQPFEPQPAEVVPAEGSTSVSEEPPGPQPTTTVHLDEVYDELVMRFSEDYTTCQAEVAEQAVCEAPDILGGNDATEEVAVQIILDSSGSMAGEVAGQQKLASAKAALLEFVERLPETANVALRVYGHTGSNADADRELSCAGTELLYPFELLDVNKFATAVESFEPTGWTPIASSLEAAQADFATVDTTVSANFVYLVSDGIETCDGDPVAAAQALHESDIQAVINVIGFDVDAEAAAQLQAVAEAGGGEYIEARTNEEIWSAFNETNTAMWDYYNCVNTREMSAFSSIQDAARATFNCTEEKARREFENIENEVRRYYEDGLYDIDLRNELVKRAREQRDVTIDDAREQRDVTIDDAREQRDTTIDDAQEQRDATIDDAREEREEDLDNN